MLNAAVKWYVLRRLCLPHQDLIYYNPFDRLKGTAPEPDKNWRYVKIEELDKLLGACKNIGWKVFIALQHVAGLRRGEALSLKWSDIDWANNRIVVIAQKTGKRRIVPASPDLVRLLLEAHEAAKEGEEEVVRPRLVNRHNLHVQFKRLIRLAGLKPWPEPFQVLRRNCETEWAQKYPQYAVSIWIGHDITVSARHYLQVPEELYQKVAEVELQQTIPDGKQSPQK